MLVKTFVALTSLLLLLSSRGLAAESAPLQVQLKDQVSAHSDTILMKDILDSENTDLEFMQRYGNLKIQNLDAASDKIDHSQLVGVLLGAGANVDQIRFRQNMSVKLERGQIIELPDEAKQKIAQSITQNFGVPAQDIKIVSSRILPSIDSVKADGFKVKEVAPADLSELKQAKFRIVIQDFDGNLTEHSLYTNLDIHTSVVTAAQDLTSETVLGESQYVAGLTQLTSLKARLLTQRDLQNTTLKTTTSIKKDDILTMDELKESVQIKEGAVVTLSYNSAMIDIKTQGQLLESGEIGNMVRVENIDSKRTVTGRLVSKDLVEVSRVN